MTPEIWTTYALTVLALMSTPGPSHLLMLSNSCAHGFRRSLATASGDLTANALQMLAAGLGLAAIVTSSSVALSFIKWAGVVYLVGLGISMLCKAPQNEPELENQGRESSLLSLWTQGFLTSAANPKAVVFFAALFPQFISAQSAFWPQFLILSATYIVIDGLFLCLYGIGSDWLVKRFKDRGRMHLHRIGGAFMIGAAALLGVKSLSQE